MSKLLSYELYVCSARRSMSFFRAQSNLDAFLYWARTFIISYTFLKGMWELHACMSVTMKKCHIISTEKDCRQATIPKGGG